MKEIYDWAGWFRELAERIAEGGEASLVEKAKQVNWGGEPELLKHGDQGIDPFSFIYALAQKNTKNQRALVYSSVAERFGLTSPLPDFDEDDFYMFPTPPPHAAALFHDSKNFNPELLWRLFGEAVKDEPHIDPTTFRDALEIKFVARVKLTQALCLINPDFFVSVDALQYVPANRNFDVKGCDLDGFMSALRSAKQTFPGCRACEINTFVYTHYMSTPTLTERESRFFQISTNAHDSDHWEDFRRNNAVYTGSSRQGDPGRWESAPASGDGGGVPYPLTAPVRGDVILVRTGVTKGRAIGIVHRNDYAEPAGLNERSRLHVYWINKSEADFSSGARTERVAFSEVTPARSTYQAFRQATAYQPTFSLIDEVKRNRNGVKPDLSAVHPLNQILYGPPGTGKTWHTVTRSVAIVEGRGVGEVGQEERAGVKRRFDEHREAGRIEMVTFTQNTTYEDFVEGIRPVLAGGASSDAAEPGETGAARDVRYELSLGVFRRVAERATMDGNGRYVLIIDEISRGNVARIFGELITLIEDSKRVGRDDEARVTLPGSKAEFRVPANLYVVGTMNTADRSIALLDSALRRRFVFEEMMPDPTHPGVSEDADGVDCRKLLAAMNGRIAALLDREHQIGHTYFLGVDTLAALARTFQTRILPLLQEYFYDDWGKIRAVLNDNGFLQVLDPPEELVRLDLVDAERAVYGLPAANDNRWTNATAYRAIYESNASAAGGSTTPDA